MCGEPSVWLPAGFTAAKLQQRISASTTYPLSSKMNPEAQDGQSRQESNASWIPWRIGIPNELGQRSLACCHFNWWAWILRVSFQQRAPHWSRLSLLTTVALSWPQLVHRNVVWLPKHPKKLTIVAHSSRTTPNWTVRDKTIEFRYLLPDRSHFILTSSLVDCVATLGGKHLRKHKTLFCYNTYFRNEHVPFFDAPFVSCSSSGACAFRSHNWRVRSSRSLNSCHSYAKERDASRIVWSGSINLDGVNWIHHAYSPALDRLQFLAVQHLRM
jgi:hypothetical protein